MMVYWKYDSTIGQVTFTNRPSSLADGFQQFYPGISGSNSLWRDNFKSYFVSEEDRPVKLPSNCTFMFYKFDGRYFPEHFKADDVETTSYMFYQARLRAIDDKSVDYTTWDMRNCTDISSMFKEATIYNSGALTTYLWDMPNLINDDETFKGVKFEIDEDFRPDVLIEDLYIYHTAIQSPNLKTMVSTFEDVTFGDLNNRYGTHIDVRDLDASSVEDMTNLFLNCDVQKVDFLYRMKVNSVKHADYAFAGTGFEKGLEIRQWNMENLETAHKMFFNASVGAGINYWKLSNVKDVSYMFASDETADTYRKKCTADSSFQSVYIRGILELSNCDVQKVEKMEHMFENTDAFKSIHMSNWNTIRVQDYSYMFCKCTAGAIHLDGWNTFNMRTMAHMFDGAVLVSKYVSDDESLDIDYITDEYTFRIGDFDVSRCSDFSYAFRDVDTYKDVGRLGGLNNWNVQNGIDFSYAFAGTPFNEFQLNWGQRFSNAKNFTHMFQRADFNADCLQYLENWNIPSVTDMSFMFDNAILPSCLHGDVSFQLSNWNLGIVNLENCFSNMQQIDSIYHTFLYIDGWDITNVTSYARMFYNNPKLNYIVVSPNSDWKVQNSSASDTQMFYNCKKLPTWDGVVTKDRANVNRYFSGAKEYKKCDVYVYEGGQWKPVTPKSMIDGYYKSVDVYVYTD